MLATLCLVIAIADGDTLRARCDGEGRLQEVKVRLAEIDAPEKGQAFGQRSKASLAALCFGAWATVRPEKMDRYGRTVARVGCRGQDASSEQIRRGMAWVFTRYSTDPAISALEAEAKRNRAGLWADSAAVPPWEWRHRARSNSGRETQGD